MHVFRSLVIDAPITRVWEAVRAFDGVATWNPGVTASRMESGTATSVGSIRHLDGADGSIWRETLLAHSDREHSYTYDIVEGPLPCADYVSTNRFVEITEGAKTLGIWECTLTCDPADAAELEHIVGELIYVGGMTGLNDYLKG